MQATSRVSFVDIVKAISIILVVIGHYNPVGSPPSYLTAIDFIYTFHMPVFMCMAGFLFYRSFKREVSYKSFVVKKFKRLMIPYFFFSLLIISIKLIFQQFIPMEHAVVPMDYLSLFLFPKAAPFLWFIYTLFIIFLLVVPVLKYCKQGLVLLLIIALPIFFIHGEFEANYFCFLQFKGMLIYFVLGCIASRYLSKIPMALAWLFPLITIHLILFYTVETYELSIYLHTILSLFMGISGCLSLIILSEKLSKIKGASVWIYLGVMSSAIYLFHTMCMAPFKYLWLKYIGIDDLASFIISAIIVCLAGIILPVFIKKLINRSRLLSKIILGE